MTIAEEITRFLKITKNLHVDHFQHFWTDLLTYGGKLARILSPHIIVKHLPDTLTTLMTLNTYGNGINVRLSLR